MPSVYNPTRDIKIPSKMLPETYNNKISINTFKPPPNPSTEKTDPILRANNLTSILSTPKKI